MKQSLSLLALAFFTNMLSAQTWIPLTLNGKNNPADISIRQSDNTQFVFDVSINGFYKTNIIEGDHEYQQICLEKYHTLHDIGKPELPILSKIIGVPKYTKCVISIVDSLWIPVDGNYRIYPSQAPIVENEITPFFDIDSTMYEMDSYYPNSTFFLSDRKCWRGLHNYALNLCPFKYNPQKKKLYVMQQFTVKVSFVEDSEWEETEPASFINKELLSKGIDNYNELLIQTYEESTPMLTDGYSGYCNYLIITNSKYAQCLALKKFMDWKTKRGYALQVITTEEIGRDSTSLRNYVKSIFQKGLEYLLLVGDDNEIPLKKWDENTQASYDTGYGDQWYGCMSEHDYDPDIAVGRFYVQDSLDLEKMVNRTIDYESNRYEDETTAQKVLLVAHKFDNYNQQNYHNVMNEISAQSYLLDTPIFSKQYGELSSNGGTNATNTTLVNEINKGYNIICYRGHGDEPRWAYGWSASNNDGFSQEQVNQINYGKRLSPIVFSITCHTARMYKRVSLLEAFMDAEYGAVAYYGATTSSDKTQNDAFTKELFNQLYNKGIYKIGDLCLLAHRNVISQYASNTVSFIRATANAKIYLWGGDPSLELWTSYSNLLCPPAFEITQGDGHVSVNTKKIGECRVSISSIDDYGQTYYASALVNGNHTFSGITVPCYINVRKHNYTNFLYNDMESLYLYDKTITTDVGYVGRDINIEDVTIEPNADVGIDVTNSFSILKNFTCKKNATFYVK